MAAGERILVIKLSALGDFIQALGPFAAIRHHNPDASITLLTTAPFAGFAKAAPWFDTVLVDDRPRIFDFGGWLRLRGKLRSGGFARIYDLQTSGRSGFYFRLFWPDPKPQWSGIARGCSHPHSNLERDRMHSLDRQREQLQLAGIEQVPEPDLSWINDKTTRVGTGGRYAILVPGGAPHRLEKRWPAARFAALAAGLEARDIRPVLVGNADERSILSEIASACQDALNLGGETGLEELAGLARGAVLAVGNDTGPMHLAAVAGIPAVILFSAASEPNLCAPRGPKVTILRAPSLDDLSLNAVEAAITALVP